MLTVLYIPLLASCVIISLTFNGHPIAHAIMLVFLPAYPIRAVCLPVPGSANTSSARASRRRSPLRALSARCSSPWLAHLPYSHARMMPRNGPLVGGCRSWRVFSIGAVGTFGDLCASCSSAIWYQDMGHLLKGHGGVMDRVDSILMSAPFTCALLWITGL